MQAPFNDLYASSVDVMKRLAECNWHAWDRFTEQRNKLLGVCVDCGQRQFALWNGNGVQKPADFFAVQADIARQLSAQLVESSQVMFTGTLDAAKETVDLPSPGRAK
ncbi:MAG: hypothetical protein ACREXR_03670 [Gammaproteobacteria bacterium]